MMPLHEAIQDAPVNKECKRRMVQFGIGLLDAGVAPERIASWMKSHGMSGYLTVPSTWRTQLWKLRKFYL